MNTKVLTAILLIGIATLASINHSMTGNGGKNLQTIAEDIITNVDQQQKQETETEMGVYNAKNSRKLTGGLFPVQQPAVVAANSDASSAAAGIGGLASNLANAAAAALFGGIAATNTNSASTVNGGLSTQIGHSDASSVGPFGTAASVGNVAGAAIGGLTSGNTNSNAFTGLGLSTAINSGNSIASGFNPIATSASNTAAALQGLGLAAGGSNAGAAVSGAGISGTSTNSASGSIGGNSFSSSSSSSVAQSLGLGSLGGQYLFAFPAVPLIVSENSFIFRGCTDYTIPILRGRNGISFGDCQYTASDCGYDPAYFLARRFYQVRKYDNRDYGFIAFNDDDEESFQIRHIEGKTRGRKVYGYYQEGEYEAYHPSYNIQVEGNQLWFQGYRNKALDFDYQDGGSISFGRTFKNRKDLGFYNRDRSLYDLFNSCSRVSSRGQNKGYQFHDKKGRNLANCSPKKW